MYKYIYIYIQIYIYMYLYLYLYMYPYTSFDFQLLRFGGSRRQMLAEVVSASRSSLVTSPANARCRCEVTLGCGVRECRD